MGFLARALPRWTAWWAIVALILMPLTVVAASEQPSGAPPEPEVTATAAVVVELSSGTILWGRDIHAPRAPASVTKMMTALVVADLATLDTKVTIQESDLVGESSMGLESGETLTVEALLYGMLLPSGNDAATALARTLGKQPGDATPAQSVQRFVDKMNAKAKTLGTKETHFANPHGLDEPGHLTSAADLALIGTAFAANPTLMHIAGTVTYDGFGHTVHTTNKLLYDGRYASVVGGKTGQTDDAGYTLVEISSQNGRRMLSVELGTTADAFWTDAMHLLSYGYAMPRRTSAPRSLSRRSVTASVHATNFSGVPPDPNAGTGMNAADAVAPLDPRATAHTTTITLPTAHRSNTALAARIALLGLLAVITCGIVYARRVAVRRTFAEMKREWHKGLADPPHLVVTTQMPLIPTTPRGATPSVSSRWAQAGVHVPKGEQEVARAYALQAVRQARSGSRTAAQQAFKHAVWIAPKLEWGAIPGFWEMPPVSYADLATVMIEAGHLAIARSMLTVAALAHPRHPDLRAVEARLNRRETAPPADISHVGRR
ncbi:MAG: D-alanyl-D-alanine carboxypeptidase [Chloroflexota bacterium]|nr:D-alanyl-D-alanine carboxypeptidase [Chloroflexota bacterium]MDQ6906358.1 D-alanyl-D-alanine carboxypeptidase [Chloroflexota bacterium]